MRQQVWIINSSLLLIFIATLIIGNLLIQEPPKIKIKPIIKAEEIQKKILSPFVNIDKIVKNDIFDTFTESPTTQPIKKSLITQIPTPPQPTIIPPPQPKKQEFVNPLQIKLKGIVLSSDELKSIALIEDETQKEGLYHLGEKIKDAQIIKLSQNKIVLLRANGQQEILSLRKEDGLFGLTPTEPQEKWKYAIKKIDDFNFEIDPKEFTKKMPTLSEIIEDLSLGTAYEQGYPLGIKVGKIDKNEIGFVLGLKQNDIISSINNINTLDIKDRIKIYDSISDLKKGDQIQLSLKRNNIDTLINYKLTKLEKPKKLTFVSPATSNAQQKGLPASKAQQQAKAVKDFKQQHNVNNRRNQAVADIRKRLLEKLRARSPNVRIR